MLRSFKKAGLLAGILAVSMTLQGCNIAAIMSAAGGILAGLGQAFGGPTGQALGQIGQVLGGVGQAFGQQQQGVAGQLAGAAGPLVNGIPGQVPVPIPGQGPVTNPGQVPVTNPGQVPNTGTVGLPVQPNAQQVQQALAMFNNLPQQQRTAQQLQAITMQVAGNNQALAQAIFNAVAQQMNATNPQLPNVPFATPPFVPQNGGGPLVQNPQQFPFPQGQQQFPFPQGQQQFPFPQGQQQIPFPQYPQGGAGNLFFPAYQATTGLIQIGQQIFGNNGGGNNGQPNPQQQGGFNLQPPPIQIGGLTLTAPGISIK